jgi:hypothetical protein
MVETRSQKKARESAAAAAESERSADVSRTLGSKDTWSTDEDDSSDSDEAVSELRD